MFYFNFLLLLENNKKFHIQNLLCIFVALFFDFLIIRFLKDGLELSIRSDRLA